MKMSDLHKRLLQDVLEVGNDLPFVITGGYAVQAHGIVERPSRDIDVATNSSVPMEILASRLIEGLTERGWRVRVIGIEPVSARFMVADPELSQDCEVGSGRSVRGEPDVSARGVGGRCVGRPQGDRNPQPCVTRGWLSRRWLPLGSRTAASRTP
jgi:hypothetical protein